MIIAHLRVGKKNHYDEETDSWILEHTGYRFAVGPNADEKALKSVMLTL